MERAENIQWKSSPKLSISTRSQPSAADAAIYGKVDETHMRWTKTENTCLALAPQQSKNTHRASSQLFSAYGKP